MEDAELSNLMERYARGEDGAFTQLYDAMAPRLYRFCLRLAARKAEGDDVFQETFLRIHRARATYVPAGKTMYWAYAIARSAYLDRLRYRRRHPEEVGAIDDAAQQDRLKARRSHGPEAQARVNDLREVVTGELNKMSEKNRVAYVLLREVGLSVKEAAAVLGTTTDVVKQRAHRAYAQLRTALGAAGWLGVNDLSWSSVPVRA